MNDRVYQIERAVAPAVCSDYVEQGNRLGWVPSDISRLSKLFSRSQSNVDVDTPALFRAIDAGAPAQLDGLRRSSLVKQRTTCMRYLEGEYFGAHTDSPFVSEDGRSVTKLSLILYLNADYTGGETVFPDLALEVAPAVGKVLLFAPQLRHLSKPILSGSKYVVRSEVLYIAADLLAPPTNP